MEGHGAFRRMDKPPTSLTIATDLRPVVVFANAHAITFCRSTKAWLRAAGWKWPASEYHTAYAAAAGGPGDSRGAALRADASSARPRQHLLGSARAVCTDFCSRTPAPLAV